MNYHFEAHKQVRKNLVGLLDSTALEDLLLIPDGFNNNMLWNIGHALATQQLLHYYLSGNSLRIDQRWVDTFRKGTLPVLEAEESEIEDLRYLLLETSKVLMADYDGGFFTDYKTYSTSFGLSLKSIQDAIIFNNLHEAQHLGYAMAQRRAVQGERGVF